MHFVNTHFQNVGVVFLTQNTIPIRSILTSVPVWAIVVSQTGSDWLYYLLITVMPSFMEEVMKLPNTSVTIYKLHLCLLIFHLFDMIAVWSCPILRGQDTSCIYSLLISHSIWCGCCLFSDVEFLCFCLHHRLFFLVYVNSLFIENSNCCLFIRWNIGFRWFDWWVEMGWSK